MPMNEVIDDPDVGKLTIKRGPSESIYVDICINTTYKGPGKRHYATQSYPATMSVQCHVRTCRRRTNARPGHYVGAVSRPHMPPPH